MLKLNFGFSRKVGKPNHGSRGASVNVELEVESGLIGDPDALLARIRKTAGTVRETNGLRRLHGGMSLTIGRR